MQIWLARIEAETCQPSNRASDNNKNYLNKTFHKNSKFSLERARATNDVYAHICFFFTRLPFGRFPCGRRGVCLCSVIFSSLSLYILVFVFERVRLVHPSSATRALFYI